MIQVTAFHRFFRHSALAAAHDGEPPETIAMMNDTHSQLRQLSSQDFASFGLGDVAYVRPVEMDGTAAFAIHAADGTPLSVVADRDLAFAAIIQNDMEPVSVH